MEERKGENGRWNVFHEGAVTRATKHPGDTLPGAQVCGDVDDLAVRSAENNSTESPCCAQVLLHLSFPFTIAQCILGMEQMWWVEEWEVSEAVGKLVHSCTAGMPECSWENQKPRSGMQYILCLVFSFSKEVHWEAKVTLLKIPTSYVEKGLYLKLWQAA